MEKDYHDNFEEYTEYIVSHRNYKDLKYTRRKKDNRINWVTTKNTKIGQERIKWALAKAKEFHLEEENAVYSKVMYRVHPLKETICQICGEKMSIRYIYPNKHFLNRLEKDFEYLPNSFDSIYEINDHFSQVGLTELEIIDYYSKAMKLKKSDVNGMSSSEFIDYIEEICRSGKKSTFGPGAMSNFPDRYDGYHSYNRCCRKREDTGRHDANMRSYSKDRRAYENWSDGNIHAANKFMTSSYFKGFSADHIGPISLGFVHDPRYLKRMSSGENSAKRDKLLYSDILELIRIEKETGLPAASHFCMQIWKNLKDNLKNDTRLLDTYRDAFKENIIVFMEILWLILDNSDENGEVFLKKFHFDNKIEYFQYDYQFDENGNITEYTDRNITDATRKEYGRYVRISINSVFDFHEKENRIRKVSFSSRVNELLQDLIISINRDPLLETNIKLLAEILLNAQNDILEKYHL